MAGEETAEAPAGVEEPAQETTPAEAAAPGAEDAAGDPVVFVDPQLGESEAQELAEALGRSVRVCGEEELREGAPQASLLVVPLELPTRSGLEIVASVRLHETRSEPPAPRLPILVVSQRPTRVRVRLALRAGADSFAFQPYDADELKTRLAALEARAAGA